MKKIIENQSGVTLIETVAATAIVAIILITVVGGLLYGQKMIFFSDTKNNEAAQAQELVDEIMTIISEGSLPNNDNVPDAIIAGTVFDETQKITEPKQYYIIRADQEGKECYKIFVRVYYNNGNSYIDLKAFAKRGGVEI